MVRGHRLNTSIVLAAVHGLSGLFRAVSAVEPSLCRPLPTLSPSLICHLPSVGVKQHESKALGSSLASEGICLFFFTCGRRSLVSETQNEIVVEVPCGDDESILTLLDFSLHFQSCCLLRVCRKLGRSLHLITSHLRTKQSLDCPNHVRRTKSSIKKRIIVRRTVRSMFGEQTFAQLRTGLNLTLCEE